MTGPPVPMIRRCHFCQARVVLRDDADRCPECNGPLVPRFVVRAAPTETGGVRFKVATDLNVTEDQSPDPTE